VEIDGAVVLPLTNEEESSVNHYSHSPLEEHDAVLPEDSGRDTNYWIGKMKLVTCLRRG
jgi:hypothetical protein